MNLNRFNTKTQCLEDTKIEDELSHQIIGASIEGVQDYLRVFMRPHYVMNSHYEDCAYKGKNLCR